MFSFFKDSFDVDHFIAFVTILLLPYVLAFWPWGMWNLISLTRNGTHTPFMGRWSLNHWTTREVSIGDSNAEPELRNTDIWFPLFSRWDQRLREGQLRGQPLVAECKVQPHGSRLGTFHSGPWDQTILVSPGVCEMDTPTLTAPLPPLAAHVPRQVWAAGRPEWNHDP